MRTQKFSFSRYLLKTLLCTTLILSLVYSPLYFSQIKLVYADGPSEAELEAQRQEALRTFGTHLTEYLTASEQFALLKQQSDAGTLRASSRQAYIDQLGETQASTLLQNFGNNVLLVAEARVTMLKEELMAEIFRNPTSQFYVESLGIIRTTYNEAMANPVISETRVREDDAYFRYSKRIESLQDLARSLFEQYSNNYDATLQLTGFRERIAESSELAMKVAGALTLLAILAAIARKKVSAIGEITRIRRGLYVGLGFISGASLTGAIALPTAATLYAGQQENTRSVSYWIKKNVPPPPELVLGFDLVDSANGATDQFDWMELVRSGAAGTGLVLGTAATISLVKNVISFARWIRGGQAVVAATAEGSAATGGGILLAVGIIASWIILDMIVSKIEKEVIRRHIENLRRKVFYAKELWLTAYLLDNQRASQDSNERRHILSTFSAQVLKRAVLNYTRFINGNLRDLLAEFQTNVKSYEDSVMLAWARIHLTENGHADQADDADEWLEKDHPHSLLKNEQFQMEFDLVKNMGGDYLQGLGFYALRKSNTQFVNLSNRVNKNPVVYLAEQVLGEAVDAHSDYLNPDSSRFIGNNSEFQNRMRRELSVEVPYFNQMYTVARNSVPRFQRVLQTMAPKITQYIGTVRDHYHQENERYIVRQALRSSNVASIQHGFSPSAPDIAQDYLTEFNNQAVDEDGNPVPSLFERFISHVEARPNSRMYQAISQVMGRYMRLRREVEALPESERYPVVIQYPWTPWFNQMRINASQSWDTVYSRIWNEVGFNAEVWRKTFVHFLNRKEAELVRRKYEAFASIPDHTNPPQEERSRTRQYLPDQPNILLFDTAMAMRHLHSSSSLAANQLLTEMKNLDQIMAYLTQGSQTGTYLHVRTDTSAEKRLKAPSKAGGKLK